MSWLAGDYLDVLDATCLGSTLLHSWGTVRYTAQCLGELSPGEADDVKQMAHLLINVRRGQGAFPQG